MVKQPTSVGSLPNIEQSKVNNPKLQLWLGTYTIFRLPLKMLSASDCNGSMRFLLSSSFSPCNLRTPFFIATHQAPLDYGISYCNSQILFDDYRFDIRKCINNSNKNTFLIKSKNIKKLILNDSLHIKTYYGASHLEHNFRTMLEYFSLSWPLPFFT